MRYVLAFKNPSPCIRGDRDIEKDPLYYSVIKFNQLDRNKNILLPVKCPDPCFKSLIKYVGYGLLLI